MRDIKIDTPLNTLTIFRWTKIAHQHFYTSFQNLIFQNIWSIQGTVYEEDNTTSQRLGTNEPSTVEYTFNEQETELENFFNSVGTKSKAKVELITASKRNGNEDRSMR